MWWLWFAGPVAVVVVYFLTGQSKVVDKRRLREGTSWRKNEGGGARIVKTMPVELGDALVSAGGGEVLVTYELFPKLAYLALVRSSDIAISDHQTIVGKLAASAPEFTMSPQPIVDGVVQVQTKGVVFAKHAAFSERFLIEGPDASAIKKWLTRPLRNSLLEFPGLWLRVRGMTMTLTLYGSADAALLDELVITADTLFAELGAEGGPSLLGPEAEEPAKSSAKDKPVAASAHS
jgi:hypothetical protein